MQIFIFMICVLCGILSGVIYDILYVARCAVCGVFAHAYTVKDRIFTVACDLMYCLIFAAGFIFMSVMFDFYELRLFMFIGCAVGALLYMKSFHIIVAFSVKKVYNKLGIAVQQPRKRGKGKFRKKNTQGNKT